MNFLLWNTHGKNLGGMIARIAIYKDVDFIVLCEAEDHCQQILLALNTSSSAMFYLANTIGCERITLFTRFKPEFCIAIEETSRFTIRHVCLPGLDSFVLVAAHLPSRLYADENDQHGHCMDLSTAIRRVEGQVGHERTIVMGDLNLDPFSPGMTSAKGLNAVMSLKQALKRSRSFNGEKYPLFYNPMWSHFGDLPNGPTGTYFRDSNGLCDTFWHMIDQVLFRPDVAIRFLSSSLEILTTDGQNSLIHPKGHPDKRKASDHLPVTFSVSL